MESRLRKERGIADTPLVEEINSGACAADGSWQFNISITGRNLKGTNRTMLDYRVPRFRARQKAGEVFFNPMSSEKVTVNAYGSGYEIQQVNANCTNPVKYSKYRCTGEFGSALVPRYPVDPETGFYMPIEGANFSGGELARLQTEVSTKVLSDRGRSDSDLWESIAEYDRTIRMLNGPLTELRRLSLNLYKSSLDGTASRRLLKDVSSGYLLYRYGILPLLRDIENILKSLSKVTGKQRKTTRATERIHSVQTTSGTSSFGVITGVWSNQITEVVTARAMSLDEVYVSMANALGFSTKSLLTLPYELMSYSFVADWLANIGDFIGSIAPSFGYNQLGSCLVTKRVLVNDYRVSSSYSNQPTAWTLTTAPIGGLAIVRESTTRGPLSKAGIVIVTDFKFDTFTRAADAVALAASALIKTSVNIGPQPNLSAFRNKKAYALWLEASKHN